MSNKLEELSEELKELSVEELTTLIEQASAELRRKAVADEQAQAVQVEDESSIKGLRIPGLYRPTRAEIEASLKIIFKPTDLAQMGKTDLNNLPPLPRSITDYI